MSYFKCSHHVSILIYSLFDFFSPSVLDRLNALLEPGGVLTIDERGVIDGKIPSIKPHPNFRFHNLCHTYTHFRFAVSSP